MADNMNDTVDQKSVKQGRVPVDHDDDGNVVYDDVIYNCPKVDIPDVVKNEIGKWPYSIKIKSIKDRLSSGIRAVMDERLPPMTNTIIKVMTCPNCSVTFQTEQPLLGHGTSEHRMCLYLSKVVDPKTTGEVSDEDIKRFERLIAYLIENHLVAYGVLSDPICLPLANGKNALMWYVFSDYTREELNEKLGCDCFVEEGEIYNDEWPEVVRD